MINIQKIIKDNHITTHDELQRYLYNLSNGLHYWHYEIWKRDILKEIGIGDKVELVELEGDKLYYEVVEIK